MGKRLAVLVLVVLIVGAFPAGAGPARMAEEEYNKVEAGATGVSGRFGGVRFPTQHLERFISVEIVDATGQPIAFSVYQGKNRDAAVEGCGKTAAPVKIVGGKDVKVSPLITTDPGCGPAQPTQGVVRAVFTR